MQTAIEQLNEVEYQLEITATAADLAPDINIALKSYRGRVQLKGFRPGKVPTSLVKKMYGEGIAAEVVGEAVQKKYEATILESDDYDVLGQPVIEVFDYKLDQDLRAIVRFGVRPSFELADLSAHEVTKLVHDVSDEEVDEELERHRLEHSDLLPLEDEALTETDFALVDMQQLDDETKTPIIGAKSEDVEFFLDDEKVQDALKEQLIGKHVGDVFRVDLPHDHAHEGHEAGHTHTYEITVKETKRRDLPEIDEDFIEAVVGEGNDIEDEAGLRAFIKSQIEEAWNRRGEEFLESNIVEKIVELHEMPVPRSVEDLYLDSFVEELKQYAPNNEIPAGFNVAAYREGRRPEATKQARWMFVRDQIVKDHNLEVADADLDAHFGEMAGDSSEVDTSAIRKYYEAMPQLMDQLNQQLLSKKVFAYLGEQFQIVEKDRETIEQEFEAKQAEEAARIAEAATEAAEAAAAASNDDEVDAPVSEAVVLEETETAEEAEASEAEADDAEAEDAAEEKAD